MSIGVEDAKGNDLVRKAHQLLKDDQSVNFIGNVEGRDLFSGACDVMVCEGFVGNVVLKLMEGMAIGLGQGLIVELTEALPGQAEDIKKAGISMMGKYDFNEYGGAPLLGVDGICIICHGASDYRGIMNAVRVTKEFASHHVNEQIIELLSKSS